MIAALLGDRYRLGERLAGGGMGSVYRAVDESLGRPVAVKVLRRELADEPAFLERFRREARAAAGLSHPGVAGVYDYGELGGSAFIVMELVEGETLAERIAARGRLPWSEAFALGEQVARALAAAHAHRLVHRDVKPGNILIGPGERAKVTDFGIAKAASSATLTRTGMVLGSANYVAPEQAKGEDVGPAADQYSLGCVLYEAVCGRTPYAGANPVAIATQHVSAPVPDPRQLRPTAGPGGPPDRRAWPRSRATVRLGHGHGRRLAAVASGRSGAPARRSSWWALGAGTLVGVTSLLLAWRPRGVCPDPPAGRPERQLDPLPTVDNGDEDD